MKIIMKLRISIISFLVISLMVGLTGCVMRTPQPTIPLRNDFGGVNSASSKTANGLSLNLSLDAKTYYLGQKVQISLDEKNTQSKTNSIPAAENWPLNGLIITLSLCQSEDYPFGIAVYQGDLSSSELSNAVPVHLYNMNGLFSCVTPFVHPTSYSFKPGSDIADLTPKNGDITVSSYIKDRQISAEVGLKGYWTDGDSSRFRYFEPGIYTMAGGDEWGNVVVIHFTVLNAVSSAIITTPQNSPVEVLLISARSDSEPKDDPTIEINLKNVSPDPIVSLNAVLIEFAPVDYNFGFSVTTGSPLLPGRNVIAIGDLPQGQFGEGVVYSLKISGTFRNGKTFSFMWYPPDK